LVHRQFRQVRRGFTLIEAAVTTVILGVGFVAMLELFGATTKNLRVADAITSSTMLADHVMEMTQTMPFNDPQSGALTFGPEADETTTAAIDDLDDFRRTGVTTGAPATQTIFDPPVDASRQSLSGFIGYRQVVVVEPVNPANLNTVVAVAPYRVLRITLMLQKKSDLNQWQTLHTVAYCRFE